MYEAGLDPDNLSGKKQYIMEGLISYKVIDKRIMELDEMADGKTVIADILTFCVFNFIMRHIRSVCYII